MKNFFTRAILIMHLGTILAQTAQEKLLTHNQSEDRYASFSSAGDQIVFESDRDGDWNIYLMDSDGKNQRSLTTHTSEDRRPSWHPSDKKIVFESNREGKFALYEYTIKTKRTKRIPILGLSGEPMFARYSPNGRFLAFSDRKSDQESNIAICKHNGRGLKHLTNHSFRTFYPNWSPDGDTLVFFSRHETNNKDDEIYKIGVDGFGMKRLTKWPKHNFCPVWSSDGTKIAYVTSIEGTRPEIYVMAANGSHQTRITFNEDGDTLPNWSPNGSSILISGYRNGNYEICELNISNLRMEVE